MMITPTEALDYIRVSKYTLYQAMKKGELSFTPTRHGREIELSELQRWHEKVLDKGPLKIPSEDSSGDVSSDGSANADTASGESSGSGQEVELLKLQVQMLEEQRDRERELIDEFRDDYKRFMNVLTDQRSKREGDLEKEKQEQAQQIEKLTRIVTGLRSKEREREQRLEQQRKEREAQRVKGRAKKKIKWPWQREEADLADPSPAKSA